MVSLLTTRGLSSHENRSLLAFAEVARIYDWNRPRMTVESLCKIRESVLSSQPRQNLTNEFRGRHPLAEIVVDSYVKNDCSLVAGRGVGWDVDLSEEERIEVAAEREEGCLDPNQSICIVTVSLSSLPLDVSLMNDIGSQLQRQSTES